MGRKIKSKNTKKIRDPLKLIEKREARIKNQINNPPSNPDDQEESKRYRLVSKFNPDDEQFRKRKGPKKKKQLMNTAQYIDKNIGSYPKDGKEFKPLPTLYQRPGESDQKFYGRVTMASRMVMEEFEFEEKYNLDVKRDLAGNVVSLNHRNKKPTDSQTKKKEKRKLRKLKLKLKKRKGSKKRQDSDEEDTLPQAEVIPFGETVHGPPSIDTKQLDKRLKEKAEIRSFLFAKNLPDSKIDDTSESTSEPANNSKLRARVLEEERIKAVLLYRHMKEKQRELNSTLH